MENKKFLSDSIWSLLSSLSSAISTFTLSIIYANKLGVENFGIFGLTQSTILLLTVIGCFGLNITILRYVASNTDKKINLSNHLFIGLLLSIILTSIFLFLSALELMPFVEENNLLIFVGFFVPFCVFSLIFEGVLGGYRKFYILAKINFFSNIIYFFLALFFLNYFGLLGVVYSYCFLYIIKLFYFSIFIYKEKSLNIDKVNFSQVKDLVKESLPVALQEIMQNISGWVLIILILNQSSYKEVGLFNVALQIMMIILFIPGVMKNVVLSYLSSGLNSIRIGLYINVFSVIFIGVFLVIFSDYFLKMYSNDFSSMNQYMPVIVMISLIISICNIYVQKMIALKENWKVFYSRLVRDLIIYIIFILMVQFNVFNVISSVFCAYIIANVVYFILVLYQVKKYR